MVTRFLPALRLLLAPALVLGTASLARAEGSKAAQGFGDTALHWLPVTNSMLTSVLVTAAVIFFVRWLVGRPTLVPTKGQAVVESAVEALRELYHPIVGKKAMSWSFPVLSTLFLFILFHNWSGLIPGVGTVGVYDAHGHLVPFLRPHTADLNGTIALAIVSFGAWLIIIFKFAGPKLIWQDLFGNKADRRELSPVIYHGLSLVFLVVGLIEVFSIFIRPVTLSMRLFGNVFGGESLLHAMPFAFPFYFLELLVGFVQALVFTLLSAVYIGLICNHGDDHAEGHAHSGEAAHH